MLQLKTTLHVIVVKATRGQFAIFHSVELSFVKMMLFVSLMSTFQFVNAETVMRVDIVKLILTIANQIHVKIMDYAQISSVDMNVTVEILDFMDQTVKLILMNVSLNISNVVDKEHA